jgi:hypothetical protein
VGISRSGEDCRAETHDLGLAVHGELTLAREDVEDLVIVVRVVANGGARMKGAFAKDQPNAWLCGEEGLSSAMTTVSRRKSTGVSSITRARSSCPTRRVLGLGSENGGVMLP